ncbi:GL14285 [Drosophila persimilis]|uniref:GL14285 n=1 Tax=Drosophila persimilis TaxID=7234 RepID=B4GTF2_DROPE|nr:GL14285 [Drosophila persimilis]
MALELETASEIQNILCETLGVGRNASNDYVRKAFRKKSSLHHLYLKFLEVVRHMSCHPSAQETRGAMRWKPNLI